MSEKKEKEGTGGYSPIVPSAPKDLNSFEDLKRPNPYLNDWVQVATRSLKSGKKS